MLQTTLILLQVTFFLILIEALQQIIIIFRMRCTLYGFITDYVKDIFVEEIYFDIREKLKEVTQGTKIYCMSLQPT